jgi:osmotically-inducible protein OsmY
VTADWSGVCSYKDVDRVMTSLLVGSMETPVAEATLTPVVEQVVRDALANSPIQSHRSIRVEQSGDTLYLHGRVESFYYKQLAQEVVRNVCRGVQVSNELDVDYAAHGRSAEF